MSAINFAQENAGRSFIVPSDLIPAQSKTEVYTGFKFYAQVVGYIPNRDDVVIVQFEDSTVRHYCWPLHDEVQLTLETNDLYNYDGQINVYAVDYKVLKPKRISFEWGSFGDTFPVEKEKEAAVLPAYPSLCKRCQSPARKAGKLVLCSNKKCSIRSKFIKTLDIPPATKRQVLRCSRCGTNFVRVAGSFQVADSYVLTCKNDHKTGFRKDQLKKDDVVLGSSLRGAGTSFDLIWDGEQWVNY